MADRKRRLVMDVVAQPPVPEESAMHQTLWGKYKRLQPKLPQAYKSRTFNVLAIIFVIAASAATGSWITVHIHRNSGLIPGKYARGLTYPLYYPTGLPTGYEVDRTSFNRRGDVLGFSISAPNGKNIAVSEEPIPKNLNLTQKQSSAPIALPDRSNFTTAIGTAQISLWGPNFVSSLVTNKTWIVLNVTGFKLDDAQKVTQSFTELN